LNNNINILINLPYLDFIVNTLKILYLNIFTFYTFLRVLNKNFSSSKFIFTCIITVFISIFTGILEYKLDSLTSMLCLIFLLTILYSIITKTKFGHSILVTIISLSINYILFFIAITISFIINTIFILQSDYINLLLIIMFHYTCIYMLFKTPRFKNGFSFLQNNLSNEYFEILILSISVSILFSFIILNTADLRLTTNLFFALIIFSIISFITIQKTLTMYYKHKLLVTELEDTKSELDKKVKEIADLEAENLEFSKTSHSIAHKQKSLEHKLNKLMFHTEAAEESDLRDRLKDISNQFSKDIATTPIPKTEIEIIDDMISCMNDECKDNNIDFDIQLNGNIHHMINNFISAEELEILLADHIKDAIIAINYSDNINKSILVKLGLFDGEYKLSIYDSGIEFEIETLFNLGITPSTTHSDNGGTGMGFMNTFDTLRKHNASLYINEIGKPNKDNYTKSVTISFNNKNEYKVTSYRANEIKEKNNRNDLIIE